MFFVLLYTAAIIAANLLVAAFGPAVTPVNAFLLIGLDLSLRDKLHDRWQGNALWLRMLAMICTAGVLSWALNPAAGVIAVASALAFVVSSAADAAVYQALHERTYLQKSNASNFVGAAVDSLVFPAMAFGGLMPEIVAMQFAAKVAGGAAWTWALNRWGRA